MVSLVILISCFLSLILSLYFLSFSLFLFFCFFSSLRARDNPNLLLSFFLHFFFVVEHSFFVPFEHLRAFSFQLTTLLLPLHLSAKPDNPRDTFFISSLFSLFFRTLSQSTCFCLHTRLPYSLSIYFLNLTTLTASPSSLTFALSARRARNCLLKSN